MPALDQFVDYLRSCYQPDRVSTMRLTADLELCLSDSLERSAAVVVVGDHRLDELLARDHVAAAFTGWSPDGERVAILDRHNQPRSGQAPARFRVAAIVPVYNEADVIEHTLEYLIGEGIAVHVIDNWSTDATPHILQRFHARGAITVERFPAEHPSDVYDLRGILRRVEDVALQLEADWIILHDADERRRSPWPGIGLRDALYHVDSSGFTCIDHMTLTFWPVDDGYDGARDVESCFRYFEFSSHPGHFHQRRAWKNPGKGVSLAPSAGHDVGFSGRRVYPYRFLLKHYPLRSRAHAQRKVLEERRARFNPEERSLGWHRQYDELTRVIRDPEELTCFEPRTFYERWLIQRLSGIGVFDRPPDWATPPTWCAPAAA